MYLPIKSLVATLFGAACIAGILSAAHQAHRAAPPEDAQLKQDFDLLQGRWETYTGNWIMGGVIRVVKTVRGDTEIVEYYMYHTGEKIRAHRNRFRLERVGDVTIYHYFDYTVLEGPGAGIVKNAAGGRYVYRVTRDTFYEVHGMFPGEEGEFSVLVWRRLPAEQ